MEYKADATSSPFKLKEKKYKLYKSSKQPTDFSGWNETFYFVFSSRM
jgi:hypothetical protein